MYISITIVNNDHCEILYFKIIKMKKSNNNIVLKGAKEFIRGQVPSDPVIFSTLKSTILPKGLPKSGRKWKSLQNQR